MLCRHCQKAKANRPRGLCWSCYYAPGVRAKYPSTSKYGHRGPGLDVSGMVLPDPTDALPGTPAKVRVLEERAAHGQCLWHPLDTQLDDEGRPCHAGRGQPPVKAAS